MSNIELIAAGITLFVLIEVLFLFILYRSVNASKRRRDEELEVIDAERNQILQIQQELLKDIKAAQSSTKEGISRLNKIGNQAHAEWTEMTARIDEVMAEIEERSNALVDESLQKLNKKTLETRKVLELSEEAVDALKENLTLAKKVLRFFDSKMRLDDILKDLQMDKYTEAKAMLQNGMDSSVVASKLGLSTTEVSLVSHTL